MLQKIYAKICKKCIRHKPDFHRDSRRKANIHASDFAKIKADSCTPAKKNFRLSKSAARKKIHTANPNENTAHIKSATLSSEPKRDTELNSSPHLRESEAGREIKNPPHLGELRGITGKFNPRHTSEITINYTLIVMSTPLGRLSFLSSSTVLGVGLTMSIKRLCVRNSNCSILFLST